MDRELVIVATAFALGYEYWSTNSRHF